MEINSIGQEYSEPFRISQETVVQFALLSGDTNPIHIDEDYAKTTFFKRPILHGIFSAAIYPKVFGTIFRGTGALYLEQNLKFLAPAHPDTDYKAEFSVINILEKIKL